jgi:hypothetical protein
MRNIDGEGGETSSLTAPDAKAFIANKLRHTCVSFVTSLKFILRFSALPRGVFPEPALRAFKKIMPGVLCLVMSAPG